MAFSDKLGNMVFLKELEIEQESTFMIIKLLQQLFDV